jgi:hypothetical protein
VVYGIKAGYKSNPSSSGLVRPFSRILQLIFGKQEGAIYRKARRLKEWLRTRQTLQLQLFLVCNPKAFLYAILRLITGTKLGAKIAPFVLIDESKFGPGYVE